MPDPLSAAEIAEGQRLDKAAACGPWKTYVSRTDALPGRETREIVRPNGDLHPWNVLKVGNTCCWPPTGSDAELIVWARNKMPALLDAAEKAAALEVVVADFINERPEYVNSCRHAHPDNAHDYHRWQGGAEARRQLAERLDWTTPYEFGEKTAPKETDSDVQ